MDVNEFKAFETPLNYNLNDRDSRAHIGVVMLSTDHSLELEWSKLLNNQAMMFANRFAYSGDLSPQALGDVKEDISNAARYIATGLELDVIAFACTSSSIIIGNDNVTQLLNKGREKNIPATNPLLATFAALNALQATNIAVFSPYPTDVNYILYDTFAKKGFDIKSLGALHMESDIHVTRISKESIFRGVESMLKGVDVDAVFLSCTNLRLFDFIDEIEHEFKLPVITSNQAMFWHAMSLAQKPYHCRGYGKLLSSA